MAYFNSVLRRQLHPDDDLDDGSDYWYYSETAWIIKWVITGVVVLAIIGFIGGGYLHAQRRMKKGLPPKRYHMWLVPRRQRARFFPPTQNSHVYYNPGGYQGQAYPMQPYGPAPPAYHHDDFVPAYTPPSKTNPDQTYAVPPPGQPPASNVAGSSNTPAAGGAPDVRT